MILTFTKVNIYKPINVKKNIIFKTMYIINIYLRLFLHFFDLVYCS